MAPDPRTSSIRRVLVVILVLNWGVAAGKLAIAWLSNSLSVEADGFHSLLDGASNVVGLVAITVAAADPDREHPYGHRKFEVLGALIIGGFLFAAGWNILHEAWQRIRTAEAVTADWAAFVTMGATLVVNAFVAWYERRRGRELGSEVLLADSAHTRADVFATMGVLASLGFARINLLWVDLVVAVGIAGLIFWAAVRVALSGANVLADRAVLDPQHVATAALEIAGVIDCHEVRTRGTRDAIFADLRIHVDPTVTVTEAHRISHAVEARLKERFSGLRDVVVHVEPNEHEPCL